MPTLPILWVPWIQAQTEGHSIQGFSSDPQSPREENWESLGICELGLPTVLPLCRV